MEIQLFSSKPLRRSVWTVYSNSGMLVTRLRPRPGRGWSTVGIAPGIYLIDIELEFADDSHERTLLKAAIIP
jgi:hypothetical protein